MSSLGFDVKPKNFSNSLDEAQRYIRTQAAGDAAELRKTVVTAGILPPAVLSGLAIAAMPAWDATKATGAYVYDKGKDYMGKASTDYLDGFTQKCAEAGVDPDALIKQAGPLRSIADLLTFARMRKGLGQLAKTTTPNVEVYQQVMSDPELAQQLFRLSGPGNRNTIMGALQSLGLYGGATGVGVGAYQGRQMGKEAGFGSKMSDQLRELLSRLTFKRMRTGMKGMSQMMPPLGGTADNIDNALATTLLPEFNETLARLARMHQGDITGGAAQSLGAYGGLGAAGLAGYGVGKLTGE